MKKLLFALAVVGASAVQLAAQTVVYSNVTDTSIISDHYDVDFNQDGDVDFYFLQYRTTSGNRAARVGVYLGNESNAFIGFTDAAGFGYPDLLDSNMIVGGANGLNNFVPFSAVNGGEADFLYLDASDSTTYGEWNEEKGYTGLQFEDMGGAKFNAWVKLFVDTLGSKIILYSYAYSTVMGDSIQVGTVVTTGVNPVLAQLEAVTISPNPVMLGEMLNLTIPATKSGDVQISLVNTQGQVLMQDVQTVNAGDNQLRLAVPSHVATGLYFVRLAWEGVVVGRSIIIN